MTADDRPADTMLGTAYITESWRNALRVLQSMDAHARLMHFNMDYWGRKTNCGTVGCIAGHCVLDPWFQEERQLLPTWNGRSLGMAKAWGRLPAVFGPRWENVFYCNGKHVNHAEAVRRVLRELSQLTGQPVSPFCWGMP